MEEDKWYSTHSEIREARKNLRDVLDRLNSNSKSNYEVDIDHKAIEQAYKELSSEKEEKEREKQADKLIQKRIHWFLSEDDMETLLKSDSLSAKNEVINEFQENLKNKHDLWPELVPSADEVIERVKNYLRENPTEEKRNKFEDVVNFKG